MRNKYSASLVFSVFLIAIPIFSYAQVIFKGDEEAIKYRKSAFQLISFHFSQIRPMIIGKVPYDSMMLKQNIEILRVLVKLPWSGFSFRTEGGSALPKIWNNFSEFEKKQEDLKMNIEQLSDAIYSENLKEIQFFFKKSAESCKTCHENFKKKG